MSMKEYLASTGKRIGIILLICAILFGIFLLRRKQPRECPRCGMKETEFTECPFCYQEVCSSCASDYEVYATEYLEARGYTVVSP